MSFSDLTFYCRLSVLSACHSSKCEVLRHPFRSFDPLSPSFVPRCRNATLNLQTYQPQKFLHPCNSFCILLQPSRYPRTRTSLFLRDLVIVDGNVTTSRLYFRTVNKSFKITRF